ncbi:hypothetical protein JXR93_00365 [bacterium]|nr:hypothetical protein [bacterium]
MKEITEKELFEYYNDTLERCGIYLLSADSETIEYNIYEEFDIGVQTFLYIDVLNRFYQSGLISLEKLNKSLLLREKTLKLRDLDEWDFEKFKTSKEWREIMILCDEIKAIN